jgi:UDP-N-acetylmuramyl pentapeptide phosphotransferase/UDP-N-acetylglucosamine-1-phosphate transferase
MNYFPPIVSAIVTLLLIAVIRSSKLGHKFQDIPNNRSLHSSPIPRIGGVGMIAGMLSGWALMFTDVAWWIVLPLVGLFVVSLLDDMHSLPVSQRLSAHLVAAAILVGGSGLLAGQGIVVALVILLLTAWMTNLYNFMDGSDGLAGGMALFGFGMYGVAALIAHDATLAMLNFTISAVALSFLYFNFPPAKVFMGDAGSIPLGFLAAAMGLWGWQQGHWAIWFPVLVFSPFIVDASVTLATSTLRGAKVTEAHREHYYQRLIRMGWGHRKVALAEYILMLAAGVSALASLQRDWPWFLLMSWCGIYALLMFMIDLKWKKEKP